MSKNELELSLSAHRASLRKAVDANDSAEVTRLNGLIRILKNKIAQLA